MPCIVAYIFYPLRMLFLLCIYDNSKDDSNIDVKDLRPAKTQFGMEVIVLNCKSLEWVITCLLTNTPSLSRQNNININLLNILS